MDNTLINVAFWVTMAFFYYTLFNLYLLIFKEIKNPTICTISFVVTAAISALQWQIYQSVVVMLVFNLTAYILLAINFKGKWHHYIFAAIGAYAIFSLAETIFMGLFTLFNMDIRHNSYYKLWGSSLTPLMVYVVISVIAQRQAIKNMTQNKVRHTASLGVIIFIIFSIAFVLPYISSDNLWHMFIGIIALFLISIFLFAFMNSLVTESKERAAKMAYEMQSRLYSNELDIVKEYQYEIKSIRHNMDHHINTLNNLLNKQEYENAKSYISGLAKIAQVGYTPISTSIPELDSILNFKFSQAVQMGINVKSSIKVEEKCHIPPQSYISVIGNLFDNAIEAVDPCKDKEKRQIEISVGIVKGNFFIEISNPYCTRLVKENGVYQTTKPKKSDHGFGLSHIKNIVKSIGGTFEIDDRYKGKRVFNVKVLLYNRSRLSDISSWEEDV